MVELSSGIRGDMAPKAQGILAIAFYKTNFRISVLHGIQNIYEWSKYDCIGTKNTQSRTEPVL